jgi:hypothetical protein
MRGPFDIEEIYIGQVISYFSFGPDYATVSINKTKPAAQEPGRMAPEREARGRRHRESGRNRAAIEDCDRGLAGLVHLPYK